MSKFRPTPIRKILALCAGVFSRIAAVTAIREPLAAVANPGTSNSLSSLAASLLGPSRTLSPAAETTLGRSVRGAGQGRGNASPLRRDNDTAGFRKKLALVACLTALVGSAQAQAQHIDYTKGIDWTQNLGQQVPLDTWLRDESGKAVHLQDVFDGRPVILVPIAFRCQTACAMVTDGLLKTLTAMTRIPRARLGDSHNALVGRDFDVVFVSIDPLDDDPQAIAHGTPVVAGADGDTPLPNTGHVASMKKELILNAYDQPSSEHGWHLLTGKEADVRRITNAIGLQYVFNPKTDVIRNPTGIVFLTPSGKISSYILGTDYATTVLTNDVKIAAQNQIGQKTDKIMFVCFTPDPETARNRVIIESVVKWVCLASLLGMIAWIVKLSLPDWRKPIKGHSLSPR